MFNILESHYMIDIPTDPELLASMLDANARDWAEVLHFLDTVSQRRGIILETHKVVEIMKRKLGIE